MLDEAMVALAASVGSGVVQAAGTDAWTALRDRLARVLGRRNAHREGIQLEHLDRTAAELAAAGDGGPQDGGSAERARLGTVWRTRVEVLLEQLDPAERAVVAAELRTLLGEAAPAAGAAVAHNVFHGPAAIVSGDGNVQVNRFDARP
ncbi:hypothetical protein ACIBEA_01970 [Streptomyces sp. NPDC051555]|uniref:hypothetical protein n=1 Tax=Streptomyces sp. NPDC051555 TaxID=3365657 RepID=UPI0037B58335